MRGCPCAPPSRWLPGGSSPCRHSRWCCEGNHRIFSWIQTQTCLHSPACGLMHHHPPRPPLHTPHLAARQPAPLHRAVVPATAVYYSFGFQALSFPFYHNSSSVLQVFRLVLKSLCVESTFLAINACLEFGNLNNLNCSFVDHFLVIDSN